MLTTLRTWRDAIRARLIDDWKKAYRYSSVWFATIGAAIKGFALAFPSYASDAWNAIPQDMRQGLPGGILKALPFLLFVMVILGRVTKQKSAPAAGGGNGDA